MRFCSSCSFSILSPLSFSLCLFPSFLVSLLSFSQAQRIKNIVTQAAEVLSHVSAFNKGSSLFCYSLTFSPPFSFLFLSFQAQRIKNIDTQAAQVLRHVSAFNKVLLTGTPVQNDLRELWCFLEFLYPDVFHDSSIFDR